jgi:L-seryl-tRNA(Ser) seleniumtransferase
MADFRVIPSIDELRRRPAIGTLEARFGAAATVDALRAAAADLRQRIGEHAPFVSENDAVAFIERQTAVHLEAAFSQTLRPVINATGVILHTNLGRSPLAAAAIDRIIGIAGGYSSLEYDLARGARGRRDVHAEALLCRLTGAEAAVVVNNNAAATLLALAALASGREVVVSRGELVEIGGGFRVPDVMAQSGAVLREVGTTNRTRAADYAAAVTERTALILRVHPSNFRIDGFTERPSLDELVRVGRQLGVPVMEDIGSGFIARGSSLNTAPHPLTALEPSVEASIAGGADVCCFSGDKLLGGPQAGIVAGRAALVSRIRVHPLMRALRVDKLAYAALHATLVEYLAGRAAATVPVHRMLTMTPDEIRARADALAHAIGRLESWRVDVIAGASTLGGGSAPGFELATWLVALHHATLGADAIDRQLRAATPPIVARIHDGRVVIDLRTVAPDQDRDLLAAIAGTSDRVPF